MNFEVKFEPRDLWIGIFWDVKSDAFGPIYHLYCCPLPCLCFHWWWT